MIAPELLTAFLAATVFFASLVRTATGFGFALLAVPMMGLVLEPASAVGISLVFQIITGLPIAFHGLSRFEWDYALRLVGLALIGLLPGLLVLLLLPPLFARIMLVASVLIALYFIARRMTFKANLSFVQWAGIGLSAGFMQGVAGASGPPILAALHADSELGIASKRRIMALFFVFAGVLAVPPIMFSFPEELLDWKLVGALFLAMFMGFAAGQQLFSRMNANHFHRATVVLLVVSLGLACYPLIHELDPLVPIFTD
ncbi:sulfite exporter TauE/SafE family protein [Marinobacter sp. F3R08]|uniref:sulfite exporter TauE/SafE family protein n=1 Tax=Marinobacter sp. F3R08 TaxID=2841559 RepID=UPI001C088918|nr:sulfite exporter TauE/SafE family protein [Marinobacter sp. F3R08]MBU2953915.1 sulfite exporter TauE/SafE family protein [Marinobacter sp. F3R08]